MDGKDLQRRIAPAATRRTRASIEALRQHQQPATPGSAADILRVNRHRAAERDSSEVSREAATRGGLAR